MAFWGVEVKAGSPYVHRLSDDRRRFHLSQATLGSGSSTKKSIVQCTVGDAKPINLCTLFPERNENCSLNLEFEEDNDITFSVIGPHSVHLSGFFFENEDAMKHDCCPSDSDGEDIAETDNEESTDFEDTEDEDMYGDDFIDDGFEFSPSPVPNSGVVIEEIPDDEKHTNENGISKQPKKKNQSRVSDGNDDSKQQIVVKRDNLVPVIESEDEDGFPVSSSGKSKADSLKSNRKSDKNKDERTDEKAKKKKTKDDSGRAKSLKRKSDDVIQDDEQARETGQPDDTSLATAEVIPENDIKEKKHKNKKNKKAAFKDEKANEVGDGNQSNTQHEEATTKDTDQVQPVGKEHEHKETTNQSLEVDTVSPADAKRLKEKKKKKQKKNKKLKASSDEPATDENKSTMEVEDKSEDKTIQTRSFPNGLVIEEVAMGKPDGKRASPGKQVTVHYIGKLKKNGKIFDSNVGRSPFKFRLGVGQVIKGWDVGVNGMRVGDKRRLTIPPAMGYGAQGAGGAIPPNSWLVFDVELVDVR